jgi:tetratricopeptide (TPR) repeat protein
MVALQYVPGRVASPLLRDVLSDPAEDIRLLAYGMLDNQEKRINRAIDDELQQFGQATTDAARLAAAQRLSDLYWELVYQRLALGDLRQYAIDESLRYCEQVLAEHPASAAMILRRGRLRHEQGDYAAAEADYRQAQALGLPATRVLPYLAEARFEQRDFAGASRLVQELSAWNSLPACARSSITGPVHDIPHRRPRRHRPAAGRNLSLRQRRRVELVNQIIRAFPEYRFAIVFLGSRREDYGAPNTRCPTTSCISRRITSTTTWSAAPSRPAGRATARPTR